MPLSFRPIAVGGVALLLAACAAGPDYVRPTLDVPTGYKENTQWKTAEPRSVDGREPWWTWYGDPTLDALVDAANAANLSVVQAEAQYREALAAVDAARAGYWPSVGVNVSAGRAASTTNGGIAATAIGIGVSASWEPDLFGSVRRSVEAGVASAEASAGDLGAARLAIQSALAQDYLQLRYVDAQRQLEVLVADEPLRDHLDGVAEERRIERGAPDLALEQAHRRRV